MSRAARDANFLVKAVNVRHSALAKESRLVDIILWLGLLDQMT